MIHVFSAKNFFSFEDEVSIDFRIDDNVKKQSGYITTKSGTSLSLVQIVMGPNASGKTTALRALSFIEWFLVSSLRRDVNTFPLQTFAGADDTDKPSEFNVVFEIGDKIYDYSLAVSKKQVLHELLQFKSKSKQRLTTKKLFERTWNETLGSYIVDDISFGITSEYWTMADLKNTSLITAVSRFGHKTAQEIVNYWKLLETNVESEDRFIQSTYDAYRALRYYEGHEDSRKKAEEAVRSYADFGISGFGEGGMIKHKFGKKDSDINIEFESSGTLHYITLHRMMETAFEKGGIVVVDEFDTFLHPLMFESLVKKFLDPSINKKQAQLLFTAQDILILNKLDKYQINFAEKNDHGSTNVKRLDRIKRGIRPEENILAKYLKSLYGGLPQISD